MPSAEGEGGGGLGNGGGGLGEGGGGEGDGGGGLGEGGGGEGEGGGGRGRAAGAAGLRTNLSPSSALKNMTATASKYHHVSSQVLQFSSSREACIAIWRVVQGG